MLKIKQIRKLKKMTQIKLANKSGLSQSYLCEVENENKKPSLDTLDKIAVALGVGIKDLID